MPLVPAQCPNCTGTLQADNHKDAMICPFCGTPFIVEKAIQIYNQNITNTFKADVINNYYSQNEKEFVIHAGDLVDYHGESTNVVLPENVKSIKKGAFTGSKGLTSIKLPEGLREIDDGAFDGCSYLESINIPKTVRKIGSAAFRECTSLKNIVIPENVTEIGAYAFYGCTGLQTAALPQGLKQIPASLFEKCEKLQTIRLSTAATEIGNAAFRGCVSLHTVEMGNNVTKIDSSAFQGCAGLQKISLSAALTRIEDYVFANCSRLQSIVIPDRVTHIGNAFGACSNLQVVTLPNSYSGGFPFSNLPNLTTINIPDYIRYVEIRNCPRLVNVKVNILPNRVLHFSSFQGTPFFPIYQRMLKQQGYCPKCMAKMKGLVIKTCPNKWCK